MATSSSVPAWKSPWTEEPVGRSSQGQKELDTTEVTQHSTTPILYQTKNKSLKTPEVLKPQICKGIYAFPHLKCQNCSIKRYAVTTWQITEFTCIGFQSGCFCAILSIIVSVVEKIQIERYNIINQSVLSQISK